MNVLIAPTSEEAGAAAAASAASCLRDALKNQAGARMIVATGTSQFHMLAALVERPEIDWQRVTGFHLDEYIGIDSNHPASFCRYLRERFVQQVPLQSFH